MIKEAIISKGNQQEDKSLDKIYTLEEYFELEERAVYKSEFVNGKIIKMAGGSYNHSTIGGTFYALLLMLFFNSDEEISVINSDHKVYIEAFKRAVYTDAFVVVGKKEMYNDGNQAILNPTMIVEVASKSTNTYDRTGKFRMYQSLPSFKEYVLVNQDAPIVEVFYKMAENKWQMTAYVGLDKVVVLESLNVELKMSDIYKKAENLKNPQAIIEFPEDEKS